MSDHARTDGLADLINLVAAPIAGGLRAAEQVRRGVDELFRAVENLNRTMENLNDAAERVNRLLGDLEEPIRIMIPQLTRTVRVADDITQRLDPRQLGEFMTLAADLVKRLGPLAALAENAGGLFGLRLPGAGLVPRPAPAPTSGADRPSPTTSTPARSKPVKPESAATTTKAGKTSKAGKGSKSGKRATSTGGATGRSTPKKGSGGGSVRSGG